VTGQIVSRPDEQHECSPGWRWVPCTNHDRQGPFMCPMPDDQPHDNGIAPTPWEYPAGTVWECDGCLLRWVSLGSPAPNAPGVCCWRRESFARTRRWWRNRRRQRDQGGAR
jgi:hypothetical protein